jgi:hypothetical protein
MRITMHVAPGCLIPDSVTRLIIDLSLSLMTGRGFGLALPADVGFPNNLFRPLTRALRGCQRSCIALQGWVNMADATLTGEGRPCLS